MGVFVVLNSGLKAPDSAHNWKGLARKRGKWLFRERWPPVRLPKHQRQLRTQKKFLTRHKTFVSYFLLFCENLCKLFQAPVLRSTSQSSKNFVIFALTSLSQGSSPAQGLPDRCCSGPPRPPHWKTLPTKW